MQGRLVALARPVGVVDADEPAAAEPEEAAAKPAMVIGGSGLVAILGIEIEPPGSGWPPAIADIDWWDLGFAEDRTARHRIVRLLSAAEQPPRAIVVVCSLAATPDRGTGAFLASLEQASPAPVVLLATDGQRLRQRAPRAEVEQRITDWRTLAAHAGITADRVLDLDLDHLTADSRGRLARPAGRRKRYGRIPARHLDAAFELIVAHAQRWAGEPDLAERAELQRAIAALWEADGGGELARPAGDRLAGPGPSGAGTEERRRADGRPATGPPAPRSPLARRRCRRRRARLHCCCGAGRACRHRLAARLGRAGCRADGAYAQAERGEAGFRSRSAAGPRPRRRCRRALRHAAGAAGTG
ncbi:MAG: DUF2868 domain-containing protein [Rhodospirillales bacterium]